MALPIQEVRWFFTTIAVLLGTGILGLPLNLVTSGFWPFFWMFSAVYLMQLAIVYLSVDLIQRSAKRLSELRLRSSISDAGASKDVTHHVSADLHTMGRLYLSPIMGRLFDFAVLLTFVSTLISYSLAGADAYAQLLDVSVQAVITPFVLVCTFLVIFAEAVVQPVVSVLTIVKVAVLVLIIGLCGRVAKETGLQPHQEWSSIMQPFLVGTVAIGGIADMAPVMVGNSINSAHSMSRFRLSVSMGIGACYLLNLLWAAFVLDIVPQTIADALREKMTVSLEAAANAGQIATVPVTQVINSKYGDQYGWFASCITAFITLSITVSFNAIGLGLKHVLDGVAAALTGNFGIQHGGDEQDSDSIPASTPILLVMKVKLDSFLRGLHPSSIARSISSTCSNPKSASDAVVRFILYGACFGSVLGIALANPSGFLTVLETATSMALNMAGGVFVVMMYVKAREIDRLAASDSNGPSVDVASGDSSKPTATSSKSDIALPLDELVGKGLAVFVMATFLVAVLYDVHGTLSRAMPSSAAGWLTGCACVLLWHFAVKPMRGYLLGAASNGPAAAAVGAVATGAKENSSLLGALKAPSIRGSDAFAEGAAITVAGTSYESPVSLSRGLTCSGVSATLLQVLLTHFQVVYDVCLLATVAWTHSGLDEDKVNESMAVLTIILVLTHQLLLEDAGIRQLTSEVGSSPIHNSSGSFALCKRAFISCMLFIADGIAPITISGLSFDLRQTWPAVFQLLFALISACILLARFCKWRQRDYR